MFFSMAKKWEFVPYLAKYFIFAGIELSANYFATVPNL